MTFKEAKKILKKEGYFLTKVSSKFKFPELPVWEKQEVIEVKKIVNEHCFAIVMSGKEWFDRQERLKKEHEKNTKAPAPGEEQPKEGNPALKEAASQFNDALLYEQAKKIKRLGKEIAKLNGIIHDKNAVLSDVAEELRLTKIREKNLAELCLKYVGENEKLNEKLKSINMNRHNERICKKQLAEKDEVISDLGNELAATKKELEEKTKLVEVVRKGSKEYCEYGIAAEKMIQKLANIIVYEGKVSSKEFEEYRRLANGYRYNPQLYDFIEEEVKKLNAAKMVDINAKCLRAARESINDVFESYAAKYAKSSLDDLKEKAYELFNAKAHNLGLVGSKDGNGIIDQMVGADFAEEGGDQSATIVECGKDIDDVFEEIKRLCQE